MTIRDCLRFNFEIRVYVSLNLTHTIFIIKNYIDVLTVTI